MTKKVTAAMKQKSKVTKEERREYTKTVWTIANTSRDDHPAVFPAEIPFRLAKLFSFYGETVLGPFAGSGTTARAVIPLGRRAVCVDQKADYVRTLYVAAFFAYHHHRNSEAAKAGADQKVRIFQFDQRAWRVRFMQYPGVNAVRPHFSILEFIAIDNQRLVPQQSVSSLTNVDDIESYIHSLETRQQQYLQIIDLPLKERPFVMRELSVMGITAGSLFPGVDGTCEELRERFFEL